MRIKVDTNAADVAGLLRRIFHDQVPFATSSAINTTAKQFQKAQRAHQRRVFEVRRPTFMDRAVKIRPFASKRKLEAVVSIDPPGGAARSDIITKFEQDRRKAPRSGSRLAIPTHDVPKTAAGIVRKPFRPASLELKEIGRTRSGGKLSRGKKRTFAVREPGGRGFIAQRIGRRGSGKTRLLFVFEPEVPIRPELHFHRNAQRTVSTRFPSNFATAFDKAVRGAR